MRRIRRVAICCRDTLRAAGLRHLLVSYFPPMEIDLYATSGEWIRYTDYDMYFVEEEERRLWAEIAARKLVHLSLGAGQGEEGECFLDTSADQHSMVEAIKGFFGRQRGKQKSHSPGNTGLAPGRFGGYQQRDCRAVVHQFQHRTHPPQKHLGQNGDQDRIGTYILCPAQRVCLAGRDRDAVGCPGRLSC